MASIFSHPAVPAALGLARLGPKRLLWACALLTVLPDADVLTFRLGVPYASQWGHRGFTHSVAFALAVGLSFVPLARLLHASRVRTFLACSASTLSHGVLDAMTDGGLGVAFFWPLSPERHFFPWRPIEVSPIGAGAFFGMRGLEVLLSEAFWVWVPLLLLGGLLRRFRQGR